MSYINRKQSDLCTVLKPYQYIGGEYLSYNKDFESAEVKIALAFPDKYEIAISNLGQKILYSIVNNNNKYMADRVYAPDIDYKNILERKNETLTTLESKREVNQFDFVGFSLQYELAYPTMIEMLKLSKIPILREEREEKDPIILAGGPCCYNPAPIEEFIDLFMIGDGEELITDVLNKYRELKGKSRKYIIKELSKIEGIYSPELRNKTKKRIYNFKQGEKIYRSPIPYSSAVHDRSIIEIRRGCGRMCRFCQAGHVNLPIRERNAEDIIRMVKESIKETGYNEYSLLSLSSNDYRNIESVIECLSEDMNKKRVSVSLPSQRIDRYSSKLAQMVRGVRATTATLAPEAGSQRLRNVINKNLTEEQIINTILECYKSGFSRIKLYFMIGLPTETTEDLDEMLQLFKKIRFKGKELKQELGIKDSINLTCSVSIFVPKPFTPFQWCGQNKQDEIKEKIKYLLDGIKTIKGVKINYHNSFVSKLECAITRGDKRYNNFFLNLHKKGVYLSTWDENIDSKLWIDSALECGIDIDQDARQTYNTDTEFPWDIIDTGIDKEWLKTQYKNALKEINIIPCEFNCVECGVCKNLNTHKIIDKEYIYCPKKFCDNEGKQLYGCDNGLNNKEEGNKEVKREEYRYRLKITKNNELRNISHLDWQNTIIKMLIRSDLNLCYSKGYNPSPKISLGIALPLFIESECELIDIEIYDEIKENELKEILNKVLPENIRIKEAKKIDKTIEAIDIMAQWAKYSFTAFDKGILKKEDLLYIKDMISSSNEIFIEKIKKKGKKN